MPITPKQPLSLALREWYPYYAGFTEAFVEQVVRDDLGHPRSVLDPWSGSGTTAAACAKMRISSVGVDINPVTNIIAYARLTPVSTSASLMPIFRRALRDVATFRDDPHSEDMLRLWFHTDAVISIRAVENAVRAIVVDEGQFPRSRPLARQSDLPVLACFYYTALFAAVRDLLTSFRASNPTWTKVPKKSRELIRPSQKEIHEAVARRIEFLSKRLSITEELSWLKEQPFLTGSVASLPFKNEQFDACVTSPPYATRIDYVKATLPELAVLGARSADIDHLRQVSTGTPVVRNFDRDQALIHSEAAQKVLERVQSHSSKGSASYYYPWLLKYFSSLQLGLGEATRTVKKSGKLAIVVQDSLYKDVRIDVQRVTCEIMESLGRKILSRRDFDVKNLRSRQNPRALAHVQSRTNTESLLVFQ